MNFKGARTSLLANKGRRAWSRDQLRPPGKGKRAAVTNGHSAHEQTDTRSAAPGGPTRRLQLPCFPLPRATASATVTRTSPSLSGRGAGRWGPLGNYFTRLGRRPFPSGRWPALQPNPDPMVPHRSSREQGARGQRRAGRAGGTKGACGPGRMLRSHAPNPASSWALSCVQVARLWALQEGVFELGTQRLTSARPAVWTPFPATHSPFTFLLPAAGTWRLLGARRGARRSPCR